MRKRDKFHNPEMRTELLKLGPLNNLRELLERSAKLYGEAIAFSEKKKGIILSYSMAKLKEDVEAAGTRLLHLNLKGKQVAIIGENSYAWVVAYFAAVSSGFVAVPLDKELTDEGIIRLTRSADAAAFIYSETFEYCVKDIKKECPAIEACIGMEEGLPEEGCYSLQELIKTGNRLKKRMKDTRYQDLEICSEDMCEIIYTSGTTGANKGVMLSHKNVCAVVNGLIKVTPIEPVSFSVLPISHTYEKNCNILGAIYLGGKICFNDSLKNLLSNMDLFKPHMSCMVPLFLESLYKNIWQTSEKMGLQNHLKWGLKVSKVLGSVGIDMRTVFFAPVLKAFGGNFCYIVCGGAPLRPEILKGLNEVGIEIANGYGITECAPLVTLNSNTRRDPQSIGTPVPGVSVKIGGKDADGNGEILVKGDNVMMGYYKDPKATKESFDEEGWFKTGDMGCLDRKGRLHINGRTKNLIILDNGKNVHPEEVETVIMDQVPYIKEVMVHASEKVKADKRQQVIAAQVYVDPEFIETLSDRDISKMLAEDIKRVNKKLPAYKQIHYIGLSEQEFEKTTSRKIRRFRVMETIETAKELKVI